MERSTLTWRLAQRIPIGRTTIRVMVNDDHELFITVGDDRGRVCQSTHTASEYLGGAILNTMQAEGLLDG